MKPIHNKFLGGRGKKLPWQTSNIRLPDPLKSLSIGLLERFHTYYAEYVSPPEIQVTDDILEKVWALIANTPVDNEVVTNSTSAIPVVPEFVMPAHFEPDVSRGDTEFTPDQATALSQLQDFVKGTQREFRLTGYAGTGKTFLVCHFIQWAHEQGFTLVAASPTNKAAKNLSKIALAAGLCVECTTIAKMLGQQPQINAEGVEEFKSKSKENKGITADIIILDEFSMINKANYEEVLKRVPSKSKIIFVGDVAQLPPVGEKESIIASQPMPEANLTTIKRYDGEISRVAEQIRSDGQYNSRLYPFKSSSDKTIICCPRMEWKRTAAKYFQNEFNADPDFCRFLVWTNKAAANLNAYVREILWGDDYAEYVVGDRLITHKPVFRYDATKKKKKWTIILNNSEECVIVDTPQLLDSEEHTWEYWSIPVESELDGTIELKILTEASEKLRDAEIKMLNDSGDYQGKLELIKSL